jgi:hypothetical protein
MCQATSRFTRYGDTHIYESARRSRRLDAAAPASSPGLLQRVLEVTQPVAPPADVQHMRAVEQAVEDRRRQHLVAGEQLGCISQDSI